MTAMQSVIVFIVGFFFALGLGISGMTEPHIVKGFLDVTGFWDYRLLGVMAAAIVIHATTYPFIMKRSSPLLDTHFHLPKKKEIDSRLIFGAIIFGFGWGWAGVCPGPAMVGMASGNLKFIYFVIAMLLGMKTFQIIERKWPR